MGKLQLFIFLVILFILNITGLLTPVINFLDWLVILNNTTTNISKFSEIFVKISVWLISYSIVGIIFSLPGCFDGELMSGSYFIISTILSFVLSYIVMLFEKYILYIAFGILILIMISLIIVLSRYIIKNMKEVIKNA